LAQGHYVGKGGELNIAEIQVLIKILVIQALALHLHGFTKEAKTSDSPFFKL